jgi:hypothetical protein
MDKKGKDKSDRVKKKDQLMVEVRQRRGRMKTGPDRNIRPLGGRPTLTPN